MELGTDVTATVTKLAAEQVAEEGIILSYSVTPGTYLEVVSETVKVKAQKVDAEMLQKLLLSPLPRVKRQQPRL